MLTPGASAALHLILLLLALCVGDTSLTAQFERLLLLLDLVLLHICGALGVGSRKGRIACVPDEVDLKTCQFLSQLVEEGVHIVAR